MRALVVSAALFLLAASASAQTNAAAETAPNPPSTCGTLVAAPSMPDGATANNEAMNAGNAAFLAWAQSQQQVLACRRAEIDAAHARWQALAVEYNAGAQALNAANTARDAELAQYNARGGGGRRTTSGH